MPNLPASRFQTFAEGDEIPPGFLNEELQDAIIALKAQIDALAADLTGPLIVAPQDWQGDGVSGPNLRVGLSGSDWIMYAIGTSAWVFYARLDLPHGVTLSQLVFETTRNDAGGTWSFELIRVDGEGAQTVLSTTNIDATSGDKTTTTPFTHTVDRQNYRYLLVLNITNPSSAALETKGITISYA